MAELIDKALLVRRIPYSDTSLICHFFTEQHGRITLMARGARRPKSSFRASLEPLFDLKISWRPGRTGMGTLTDVQRGASLLQPAQVLDGQELLAIASRLFQEGDPHGFSELAASLHMLESSKQTQGLSVAVWHLLDQAGLLGDLQHCWHCSAEVPGTMFWQQGHLLCGDCGTGMEISAGLRKSITTVLNGGRIMLSGQYSRTWREIIRMVLNEQGIKATDSFKTV
ncbi:DNA repair protein RecO [Mariprofundus micogutta]|uniref:DNA repair protein RecO n=1 Tax=Mariprofundus micogutta TaxID=1921010 RepID=A0A1L8CNX2_9PROT|nr:DNA repair protein RecO [Mariprofundus micogutta]GAV20583.1 DNA repair protein RecO [Mariprofundus micogutta]